MKKSDKNLSVIENFILHITHSSGGQDADADAPVTFTANELYQMAEEYIEEDHVDGKDNPEDHIVTFVAESSFSSEDQEKAFPESVVVVADFGEDGTATVATIESRDVDGVNKLLKFIANPKFP